jgi:heme A synthase
VAVSATAALAVIVFQAWIGRAVVRAQLDADLVSLHLAISLTVAALLVLVVVRVSKAADRPADRPWLTLLIVAAGGVFTVIMLGSLVHNLYFPGWPLMLDSVIPEFSSGRVILHFLHRLLSVLYAVAAIAFWRTAKRKRRPQREVTLLETAALLYVTNILVGGAHVFTQVSSPVLVAVHLGLASTVWALTVAAAVSATSTRFPAVRDGRLAEKS